PRSAAEMELEYNIFECLPDGSVRWRACTASLANARHSLQDLAKATRNDCFAVLHPTREIIFRTDPSRKDLPVDWRVFQIAYDAQLGADRAELLRDRGCGVLSMTGNEAA